MVEVSPHPGVGARPSPDGAAAPSGMDALAFATDAASEAALRDGLSHLGDAQVWSGGIRAATEVLGQGHAASLVFVDLDATAYPAGALYELAAVCEEGTAVVAFGEDASAACCREVLLAGVSDYLVKPVSAATVREAAARAASMAEEQAPAGGRVVGFAGSGGSGTTTLAAAVALAAAERGRYVSVLDLDRPFSVLAFLLDVEPAAGLEQLFEAAARTGLDPEMVDGVRAERSGRIAVYAYRFGPVPPPPAPLEAVLHLMAELKRRSHLVLVDGLDRSGLRSDLLGEVDRRVLVVEPTPGGAARAVRLLDRLGEGPPLVVVCNHTRAFGSAAGARALRRAGLRVRPGVTVPFEPTLPALCDRGWPKGQAPRTLQKPLAALAERLLAIPGGTEPADPSSHRARPASAPGSEGRPEKASRRRGRLASWWPRPRPRSRSAPPRPA